MSATTLRPLHVPARGRPRTSPRRRAWARLACRPWSCRSRGSAHVQRQANAAGRVLLAADRDRGDLDHLEEQMANDEEMRWAEKTRLLRENMKKQQAIVDLKETDRFAHEKKLLEEERKKLYVE